ncbi:phage integrase family protein [Burkholderia gladioli]|uniref:phage integrase family protein n=1 Tax=Burkholderia gladioli TaxID=28095 RepID=UPI0024464771|nr:phage integrase family protein [Burkholderia gladioli]
MKPGSLPAEAHAGGAGAADGADGAAAVPPTLKAFRDAIDPGHVYSERDLLTLYLETYPPARSQAIDRKVARNRRLRERQDAALARMEAALVEAPRPAHEIEGWFAPYLVTRLADAGVTTFEQLLGLIRRRRQRWYTAVPRLGTVGLERIVAFVDQHADSFGYLSPLAMTPRRQLPAGHPALRPVSRAPADVAPLEALRVPAELDGSAGLNRAPVPAH